MSRDVVQIESAYGLHSSGTVLSLALVTRLQVSFDVPAIPIQIRGFPQVATTFFSHTDAGLHSSLLRPFDCIYTSLVRFASAARRFGRADRRPRLG
ncbi:hypothetical protein C2E31_10100 [Rhodopirellula baltica]|nr:hypothetical protein C2E31_10100 [Rhodopirellula baltica]